MTERNSSPPSLLPFDVLAGPSAAAGLLRTQVQRFAPHFRSLILMGEAGSGKEPVARQLHAASPIAPAVFHVERVDRYLSRPEPLQGFLYLYGLCETSLDVQGELLDRIDRMGRGKRIAIACSADLRGMAASGRLRTDFISRSGGLEIRVPPLRERVADLHELTLQALTALGTPGMTSNQIEALQRYAWPGNLAELWRVCTRYAETGCLDLAELAPEPTPGPTLQAVIEKHVITVLEDCAGNKFRAAEILGISRSTLYRMLSACA